MAVKIDSPKGMNTWVSFCGLITSSAAALGVIGLIVWQAWGKQQVTDLIDLRITTVESRLNTEIRMQKEDFTALVRRLDDALDMNDAQHRALLTIEQMKKAEFYYKQSKSSRGR